MWLSKKRCTCKSYPLSPEATKLCILCVEETNPNELEWGKPLALMSSTPRARVLFWLSRTRSDWTSSLSCVRLNRLVGRDMVKRHCNDIAFRSCSLSSLAQCWLFRLQTLSLSLSISWCCVWRSVAHWTSAVVIEYFFLVRNYWCPFGCSRWSLYSFSLMLLLMLTLKHTYIRTSARVAARGQRQ